MSDMKMTLALRRAMLAGQAGGMIRSLGNGTYAEVLWDGLRLENATGVMTFTNSSAPDPDDTAKPFPVMESQAARLVGPQDTLSISMPATMRMPFGIDI